MKIASVNNGTEDREAIVTLNDFADKWKCYARYILNSCKGTIGRKGSPISEYNHSSVLVHLNDGNKKQNDYCKGLHTLMNDLFGRQKLHAKKMEFMPARTAYEDAVWNKNIRKLREKSMQKNSFGSSKTS